MGSKRKRDQGVAVRQKSKKQKKKATKKEADGVKIRAENTYQALPSSENESDADVVYDFQNDEKGNDVVLVDSDSGDNDGRDDRSDNDEESVVIETESEVEIDANEIDERQEQPPKKKTKTEDGGELSKNTDFIEFGFSSSSDEDATNGENYSDDGVLSDDESGHIHNEFPAKTTFPWIKEHDHSKQKEIADWLTMEMKDFVNYISPSTDEIMTRNRVISTLKKEIMDFWPGSEVHVFGSSATDLYLPGSDIDVVVISQDGTYENRSRLYQLSSFLRTRKLAKNIEVIAKATVPIIKFVDPSSNIHIDISFERINGIQAAKRIRKWLSSTPGLRELVLVVKQFLRSRKLNNVHVGGLGGYSTIILCYHFLKLHPRVSTNNMSILDNLGCLLIEFFELYGRNFSYDNLIIAIDPETDLPKYLPKRDHSALNTSRNPFSIVIQDPADAYNNISRSSYNLRDVKKAFGGAFQLLVDKCYELNGASYKARIGQLILGDIIKYKGKERDFNDDRDKVANHALIDHRGKTVSLNNDNDDDDSDQDNNKYFFLDMTSDSEDSIYIKNDDEKDKKNKENSKTVADFMSVNVSSDNEEDTVNVSQGGSSHETTGQNEENNGFDNPPKAKAKTKTAVDKDAKREYWLQKGLDL